METKTLMKILGIASTIIGAGATVVSEFVNEKKMDDKIEEKIAKALADKK
ncbi:MAG: hypothetical protein SOZ83_00580 [Sphaerochaetaceae bacterium]|nr:hypothetical protein [Sphaerochaetaceae bacterium]